MFDSHDGRGVLRFAFGLAILSLIGLAVTVRILTNVRHEQEIVARMVDHLRGSDLKVANELSSELSLQRSLSFLLALNVVATTIAISFVVRGYLSSERSLQDAKVLSSDILASMDAGVITTDKNGYLTSINPSGRRLLGLTNQGIGLNLSDVGSDHAPLASIYDENRQFHQPIRDRDYSVVVNGHKKTLRAGCTRLHNRQDQQIGLVVHVRDVTEKAMMEERLRRMERYMGLGSLAAGLQHEIKNPLSALSLHIQLLCERLDRGTKDPEVTELLDVLNMEVTRIGNVLDGFRNYASIHEIGRSPVDVSTLIEKLVRLLRPQSESQDVKIKVVRSLQPSHRIQADSVRLEQVFLNLALNGLASMPDGGTLCFAVRQQDGNLRIDVSDTGNGIPEEVQTKIFDPYVTTRNEGTGMGLALCDKIIRQHDGSIEFETAPQGTTFTVVLPLGEPVVA